MKKSLLNYITVFSKRWRSRQNFYNCPAKLPCSHLQNPWIWWAITSRIMLCNVMSHGRNDLKTGRLSKWAWPDHRSPSKQRAFSGWWQKKTAGDWKQTGVLTCHCWLEDAKRPSSQPTRKQVFSSTVTRTWVPPTAWISLKRDSSLEPPGHSPAQSKPWFWPIEPRAEIKGLTHAWLLTQGNCEITNGCCFKLLS